MAEEALGQSADGGTGQGNLAELGAKLSNPLSDVWALFTEFDFDRSEGDISDGEHKFGSAMLFQPLWFDPVFLLLQSAGRLADWYQSHRDL